MVQDQIALPDSLFLDIDRSGRIPLYFQISSRLESAIREGKLPSGGRLENEQELGNRLGLSRPTIRRAIQELVNKGLLVKNQGIGTQIVQGEPTADAVPTSLFDDLSRMGRIPSSRLLVHELVGAPQTVAEALGIGVGSLALRLRRIRLADGVPIAILENHVPPRFANLTPQQCEQTSLYHLMRSLGASMRVSKQRIGARTASAEEGKLLEMNPGGPVLSVERTVYDKSGKAVVLGNHCYRPDMYSLTMTLVDK